jgi:hypothetical protein
MGKPHLEAKIPVTKRSSMGMRGVTRDILKRHLAKDLGKMYLKCSKFVYNDEKQMKISSNIFFLCFFLALGWRWI